MLKYLKSEKFKKADEVSLKDLTLKTVFLITLASGKRRGEIHALRNEIAASPDNDKLFLKPTADFLGKTHMITHGEGTFKEIILPRLQCNQGSGPTDALLCPVECMYLYRERTRAIRTPEQKKLFISYMPGIKKDIGKPTISNYLKQTVIDAYLCAESNPDMVPRPNMHPHEIRQVATSLKLAKGATMADVVAAGCWKSPTTFIKHYMQDYRVDTVTKLCSLNCIAAGTALNNE